MAVDQAPTPSKTYDFLQGGGEMGKFVASKDWSKTPLGAIESWPQSLRTAVSLCLASNFPISIAWGPARTLIYNDGYWPICGAKHPNAAGQDFRECWASAWPVIGEAFESAEVGEARFLENQRMFLDRNGYLEESFFTFSFSPIRDETGEIGGLFHPVTETTAKMLSERRTRTLRDLAARTANVATVSDACEVTTEVLAECQFDLPFGLLYLFDEKGHGLNLAGGTCITPEASASPERIELTQSDGPWPVLSVIDSGRPLLVEDFAERLGVSSCGPYPELPTKAFVLPVPRSGSSHLAGVLITGVSARLPLDENYRSFHLLFAGQIATAIANARAYEEERRRSEALAELDRAKTAFFSNISHEFRTPLTLMLGPLEDLLARADGQVNAKREELDMVYRNGLRLLRLVNALLDFSRIEAGRIQALFEPVDLPAFTADLASVFRAAADKAGLQLVVDCGPLPEPVYVDRSMWEKIVLNLLSNAFKFTFSGEIRVALRDIEGRVELSVTDAGTGISASDVPRLFERFYRVEGALGRTHEGTGIGLSLVQELAKLHGGEVAVGSVLGEGSRFSVTLPLGSSHLPPLQLNNSSGARSMMTRSEAYAEEAARWVPESRSTQISGASALATAAKGRILLADDNADMRQYVQGLLEPDFEVEAVANGAQALHAARARKPDLVLSDVMMPELDGFGLLSALRRDEQTRGVPVVLLSARAGEEARAEGIEAGADDYLVKPFSARELLARVRTNVELAKLRNELARAEESRRATTEIERQWHTFDSVLSNTPDHAYIFDLEGRFTYANRALLSLWHKSLKEVVGKNGFEIGYPIELAEALEDQVRAVIQMRQASRHETSFPNQLGPKRYYEYILTPIIGGDGTMQGIAGSSRDITERKETEAALTASNRELTKANRELEEFAYVVSHDLQEPLRMVGIYSQRLLRSFMSDDPLALQFAGFVRQGVTRMEELIRDLLQFSRMVHMDGSPAAASVDLSGALSQALGVLNSRIEETGAVIAAEPLPRVRGDQTQLAQVFQNLLSNSLKYRRVEGLLTIHVSAQSKGNTWIVSVEDNGIGFEPQYAERIFGLFKRLHKDQYPGTGLGLAICRRIVERYGGRMWAEGQARQGSGVLFYAAF